MNDPKGGFEPMPVTLSHVPPMYPLPQGPTTTTTLWTEDGERVGDLRWNETGLDWHTDWVAWGTSIPTQEAGTKILLKLREMYAAGWPTEAAVDVASVGYRTSES